MTEKTPTNVPITNVKNRKYKTCKNCGVTGWGNRQFPSHAKGLCIDCHIRAGARIIVNCKWDEWCNAEYSRVFRYWKQLAFRDEWDSWAISKAATLCTRRKRKLSKTSRPITTKISETWEQCWEDQSYKIKQRARHHTQSKWDRKAKQWMRGLKTRRWTQPAGLSYGN
jgi:hypothetical protein